MNQRIVTAILFILVLVSTTFGVGLTTATYDTVSIHDIQFVTNPDSNQETSHIGDTIVVKGFVRHGPRELYLGARWGCYVTENSNDPWTGFFVIQDDSMKVNTLLGYVQEGDEVYFTGKLATYTGLTQLNILTNPEVAITIVSTENVFPEPKKVTLAEIATHAAGEQWESMYVEVENATVTNNAYTSNQAVITDGTATGYIDDYFMYYRGQFDKGLNPWPPNGTKLTIRGYLRDIGLAYFSINPRMDSDFTLLSNPPVISKVLRTVGVPTSADTVQITADIKDNVQVDSAFLHYSIDRAQFNKVSMKFSRSGLWVATIPKVANGAYVRYFLTAVDNVGDFAQMPGDTTTEVYYYVVRDGAMSIKDVQYTWGYTNDASGFKGYVVTLEGVVMVDTSDYVNNYYIQDNDSMWCGIWIYDITNRPLKGDKVRVTGTVQENYGVTRLYNLTAYQMVTPGYGVYQPVPVTTGEITTGGANAEAYESVLVSLQNLTVTNPFPDGAGNYGEFSINDGSGELRVDDAMVFDGNLDTLYLLNDHIDKLVGIHYYSFSNYKLLPRNNDDVYGHTSKLDDKKKSVAGQFRLEQNYPNPFNNETVIRFNIPTTSPVTLTVYNILGQKIRTLQNGKLSSGTHEIRWDGKDQYGRTVGAGFYIYQIQSNKQIQTKKMLFLK